MGYGIIAPEYEWNDYEGVDVRGKTLVILINDPGFVTQDPNLFNGNASVREINRSLDINLPDQFVTLSGLIHDLAKEIPKVGKVFFIEDVKLQIISRSINKINKVN